MKNLHKLFFASLIFSIFLVPNLCCMDAAEPGVEGGSDGQGGDLRERRRVQFEDEVKPFEVFRRMCFEKLVEELKIYQRQNPKKLKNNRRLIVEAFAEITLEIALRPELPYISPEEVERVKAEGELMIDEAIKTYLANRSRFDRIADMSLTSFLIVAISCCIIVGISSLFVYPEGKKRVDAQATGILGTIFFLAILFSKDHFTKDYEDEVIERSVIRGMGTEFGGAILARGMKNFGLNYFFTCFRNILQAIVGYKSKPAEWRSANREKVRRNFIGSPERLAEEYRKRSIFIHPKQVRFMQVVIEEMVNKNLGEETEREMVAT